MRKLLVSLACVCMAVPAVAIAADDSDVKVSGTTPPATEKRIEAKAKGRQARHTIHRRRERANAKKREQGAGTASPALEAIAACESGGDPGAISPDGRYRGKYQFSRATWRAMGGSGDPAQAPESVQDAMAAKLLAARGTSPWPNCA